MQTLTPLYKKTKTGATQVCNISVENDKFTVEFGQLNGSLQRKTTTCYPTNVGRANERSAESQASFEADAKWKSKVKSGYSEDINCTSEVMLPMKVKVIQDQWKNVKYPCISTPKLNGVNGLYKREEKLNLYSRGGELFHPIPHIEDDILKIMDETGYTEINVELYIDDTHLQDITSAVKKPKELSLQLEAAIFDIADNPARYLERRSKLIEIEEKGDYSTAVSFLIGVECNNREEVEEHYNQCMALGLEGTVVKNFDGMYQHNTRSSDQFKYKKALDAEYQVVGHNIDKNGHAVWTCVCNIDFKELEDKVNHSTDKEARRLLKLHTFSVKRKGTAEERLAEAAIADTKNLQWLKIEYETLSKDNKPLKPVGIVFRNCDAQGNPLE